jgi:hypothetical protein
VRRFVTRELYLEQAARRFGRGNPERLDLEHWIEMVRSGESAHAAAVDTLGTSHPTTRSLAGALTDSG